MYQVLKHKPVISTKYVDSCTTTILTRPLAIMFPDPLHRERERQRERHTQRETDRQTDIQRQRQTDKYRQRQKDREAGTYKKQT